MFLVFDTETTGFPKKDFKDPENPRITQLAWILYNKEGKPFKKFQSLIEPCGWEMPSVELFLKEGKTQEEAEKRAKFWVDNGFSQQKSLKEGRPIEYAIKHFIEAIEESQCMIAHNMNFDLAIVASEMHRLNKSAINKPKKICTMQSITDLLQLPGKHAFKWPNLTELHTYLFNKGFDGAHDAMSDVIACGDCFFELKKRKFYKLDEETESSN